MAWSTSELAKLAGTTVNAIRHYHRLGLLEEPERRSNGYKQYGPADLARLLRIRRLVELGVPLSEVASLTADSGGSPEALRQADLDHEAAIERLRKAREDIAVILREKAPPDVPAGFTSVADRLSTADSSLVHLYARLFDEQGLADVRQILEDDDNAARNQFDALPADADEATRQSLAEKYAPDLARTLRDYPWMDTDPMTYVSKGKPVTRETFDDAMRELFNEAQLDVLRRAKRLAREQLGRSAGPERA